LAPPPFAVELQDFSVLRAKTYEHVRVVDSRKTYSCHFCTFLTPLFVNLKQHIRDNHLENAAAGGPGRRKGSGRQRWPSAESTLDETTAAASAQKRRPARARSDESLLATPAAQAAR
jgi:hypothetical protein